MSFFVAIHSDYNFTGMVLNPQDSSKLISVRRNLTPPLPQKRWFMSDNIHVAYLLISKRNLSALAMFSISEAYSDNIKDSSAVGTNLSS